MDLKELLDQDDAVSPVIGVILMVAITVILAAVIATFVLGLGDNLSNTAPQASFSFDYDSTNDELTVVHDGGDSITDSELSASLSGTSNDGTYDELFGNGGSDVTAGNSDIVGNSDFASDPTGLEDATIRVVYQSSDGSSSATLGQWEGPNA